MNRARALTPLAVPSLALLVALVALRARSFHYADYVSRDGPDATVDFYSEVGAFHYERGAGTPGGAGRWYHLRLNESNEYVSTHGFLPWFEWWSSPASGQARVRVPYWPLILLAAVLPGWWALRCLRTKTPAWARLLLAAAFALWPFELLVFAPAPGLQEVGVLAVSWMALAVFAVVLLGARDSVVNWSRDLQQLGQWRLRREQERLRRGLCVECGYDLRAGTEAGGPLLARCPECGTPSDRGALPVVPLQPAGET